MFTRETAVMNVRVIPSDRIRPLHEQLLPIATAIKQGNGLGLVPVLRPLLDVDTIGQ